MIEESDKEDSPTDELPAAIIDAINDLGKPRARGRHDYTGALTVRAKEEVGNGLNTQAVIDLLRNIRSAIDQRCPIIDTKNPKKGYGTSHRKKMHHSEAEDPDPVEQ